MTQTAPGLLVTQTIATPIGDLMLVCDGHSLCMAEFADCAERSGRWLGKRLRARHATLLAGDVPRAVPQAFDAYFAGEIVAIDGIEIGLSGTAFQNTMWSALREIPPGRPFAYGVFADRLGRPQAARAVGHANGTNPLSIVVPCHRLVGADGALVNYGGGLWRKRWLLDHEARYAGQS